MPADQPPPPGQEGGDHRRPAGGPAHRSSKRGGSRWATRIERRLTAADRQQGRPRRDAQSGGGGREASQYRRTAHAHDSTPPPRGRWFHNEPGSYVVGHSHAPGAVIKPASSGRSGQVEGRRLGENPRPTQCGRWDSNPQWTEVHRILSPAPVPIRLRPQAVREYTGVFGEWGGGGRPPPAGGSPADRG